MLSYQLSTEFRECKVLNHVCLLFCSRGQSDVTITHEVLELTIQPPPPPTFPDSNLDFAVQGQPFPTPTHV